MQQHWRQTALVAVAQLVLSVLREPQLVVVAVHQGQESGRIQVSSPFGVGKVQ